MSTYQQCAAGSYQSSTGASSCVGCPARSYCPRGSVNPVTCPAGYVCPANNGNGTAFPCPPGTYSNVTGLASTSECTPCPATKYCGAQGALQPTAPCSAGYYCLGGAVTATPTDNVTGNACPAGSYCPSGACGDLWSGWGGLGVRVHSCAVDGVCVEEFVASESGYCCVAVTMTAICSLLPHTLQER